MNHLMPVLQLALHWEKEFLPLDCSSKYSWKTSIFNIVQRKFEISFPWHYEILWEFPERMRGCVPGKSLVGSCLQWHLEFLGDRKHRGKWNVLRDDDSSRGSLVFPTAVAADVSLIPVGSSWTRKERLFFVHQAPSRGKHTVEVETKHVQSRTFSGEGRAFGHPQQRGVEFWYIQGLFWDAWDSLRAAIPGTEGRRSRHMQIRCHKSPGGK